MQLDELKGLWASQNAAPLPLDVAAMEERVRAEVTCESARATTTELGLIGITTMTALVLILGAPPSAGATTAYATPTVLLGIAGYVHSGRRRRLRRRHDFEQSIQGRVDRAIADLDAGLARDRRFFVWFIVPMAIGAIVSTPTHDHDRAAWVWLVQIAAWVLAWFVTRWEIRARSLPRRQRLEQLRRELAPAPNGVG